MKLPTTQGTLTHAYRLSLLRYHPHIRTDGNERRPAYYIGDHRLFLTDAQGAYVVDWDVKARTGDHGKPGHIDPIKRSGSRALKRAEARSAVLHAFNDELGIRSVKIAQEEIAETVRHNLSQIFGYQGSEVHKPRHERIDLEEELRSLLRTNVSPNSLIPRWQRWGWTAQDFKTVFYQTIWERRLRVDLFHNIVIDKRLRPETIDVFQKYSHFFHR